MVLLPYLLGGLAGHVTQLHFLGLLRRGVERSHVEFLYEVVLALYLLEEGPDLDHQKLQLLAQVLHRLRLVDADLREALDLGLQLVGRPWRREPSKVRLVVQLEVNAQPEVKRVDLEKDHVVVLEGVVD